MPMDMNRFAGGFMGGAQQGMGLANAMRQAKMQEQQAARQAQEAEIQAQRAAKMDQFSNPRYVNIAGQEFNVPESQAATFAQQEAMRLLQIKQMQNEKEAKRAAGLEELAVPGYSLTGEVKPLRPEAQKLRGFSASREALARDIEAYNKLMDETGGFETPLTEKGAAMSTLSKGIAMRVKELDELGALTGPDWAILTAQVPQAFSARSAITPAKSAKSSLKELNERISRGFEEKMKASGYRNTHQPAVKYQRNAAGEIVIPKG